MARLDLGPLGRLRQPREPIDTELTRPNDEIQKWLIHICPAHYQMNVHDYVLCLRSAKCT